MMGVVVRHPAARHPMPPSLDAEAPFDAPDDWGAWMARAQAGDQQDYRRLLQAIGPYLRAIARRMLGQDEAEDAVQEILLVVHGVRHTYEPGRPFRPWLSTIATRRCIDILRRRQREGLRVGDALALEAQADEAPDPLERLEQAQRRERLHDTQKRPGQERVPISRRPICLIRAGPGRKFHENRLFQHPADGAP